MPLSQSNEACGVANAATRKYLTQCHLWYFPPGDAVVAMAEWCAKRGPNTPKPYFSLDGVTPPSAEAWDRMRAKWHHVHALTNVWREAPVHGAERVKNPIGNGYLHANQKPLSLMERQIIAACAPGDVVWEPFGGLMTATVAAVRTGRRAHAAELNAHFFDAGASRVRSEISAASGLKIAS